MEHIYFKFSLPYSNSKYQNCREHDTKALLGSIPKVVMPKISQAIILEKYLICYKNLSNSHICLVKSMVLNLVAKSLA
jgi:hypothetical protein